MSKILDENESGIKIGTLVKLKQPMPLEVEGGRTGKTWINITGATDENVSLTFDHAAHNHFDEMYAYCFKLPSGEEVWFEFLDTTKKEERISRLKDFLDWSNL